MNIRGDAGRVPRGKFDKMIRCLNFKSVPITENLVYLLRKVAYDREIYP